MFEECLSAPNGMHSQNCTSFASHRLIFICWQIKCDKKICKIVRVRCMECIWHMKSLIRAIKRQNVYELFKVNKNALCKHENDRLTNVPYIILNRKRRYLTSKKNTVHCELYTMVLLYAVNYIICIHGFIEATEICSSMVFLTISNKSQNCMHANWMRQLRKRWIETVFKVKVYQRTIAVIIMMKLWNMALGFLVLVHSIYVKYKRSRNFNVHFSNSTFCICKNILVN